MKTMKKSRLFMAVSVLAVTAFSAAAFYGCQAMGPLAKVGAATGIITSDQADSIEKVSTAVSKASETITPEQEYYIGRTIGAVISSKYKVYQNDIVTDYINVMGQSLSKFSDMPETFGGYHFLVLDSDEINAFAAPGGLIFVTRGILRCCKDEDAVAAVLAHEIGHVQLKHGTESIDDSRMTSVVTTILAEGAKNLGPKELASLTTAFEGSISDITNKLVTNGYSREYENQADKAAVTIMKRAGYNPTALVSMLEMMGKVMKPDGMDFAKTHPSPQSRIEVVKEVIGGSAKADVNTARLARFNRNLANI
ncbi:M48 family metalloprotease [Desulforegula conservatrix]|uniref:M48 family metalloprotease n=1 Tax=Desulforegula conservatrix TaxID=153026 RepID=UPI00041F25A7|nr:M48 family metalloprotease [Desulforegula conservatrix]